MHGVFDIVGPIMIGPSSSHTAGACRLGLMAQKILGAAPVEAEIYLSGSFAQTGRGHGTDRALVAGLLGLKPDDERLPFSFDLAAKEGLCFTFFEKEMNGAHPNTALLKLRDSRGHHVSMRGASVGGGNILVDNINGYTVELTGQYPTLLTVHHDQPGIITQVTSVLARFEINIAFMRVSRTNRGESALMILELDEPPSGAVLDEIRQLSGISRAFTIPTI